VRLVNPQLTLPWRTRPSTGAPLTGVPAGHQGPRRAVDARRDASRLGPPGPCKRISAARSFSRPPLPAPRLETLIKRPSVTGRDAFCLYSYRNKVESNVTKELNS